MTKIKQLEIEYRYICYRNKGGNEKWHNQKEDGQKQEQEQEDLLGN